MLGPPFLDGPIEVLVRFLPSFVSSVPSFGSLVVSVGPKIVLGGLAAAPDGSALAVVVNPIDIWYGTPLLGTTRGAQVIRVLTSSAEG